MSEQSWLETDIEEQRKEDEKWSYARMDTWRGESPQNDHLHPWVGYRLGILEGIKYLTQTGFWGKVAARLSIKNKDLICQLSDTQTRFDYHIEQTKSIDTLIKLKMEQLEKDLQAEKDKVRAAIATMNLVQNDIRWLTGGDSSVNKSCNAAWNKNAKFLSFHSKEQSDYLDTFKVAVEEKPQRDNTWLCENCLKRSTGMGSCNHCGSNAC